MNNSGYEDILRRIEVEQRQRRQVDNPFPPRQIFELAREHPIVHNLIERWERGDLTWEQALSGMVICLCTTNKSLFQQLTEVMAYSSTPVNIPTSPQD